MTEHPHDQPLKRHIFPCADLLPYVDRYWSWEGDNTQIPELPRLLPGTGKELVFHYESPFLLEQTDGRMEPLPQAHLACLRNRTASLIPGRRTGFISVRFRTGAFRHFCPVPSTELTDVFVDAAQILGKDIEWLSQQICEETDFRQRVALIEHTLLNLLEKAPGLGLVDDAVQRLYYGHSHLSPGTLCQDYGLGVRQFQRIFKAEVGLCPKQFIRLSRFQHTVKSLLLEGHADMTGVALNHGYYDQSHFIHEFKRYTDESPSAFLNDSRSMTHFYNTSRPNRTIL